MLLGCYMQLRKASASVSMIDAVDFLSDLAEWDRNSPSLQQLASDQQLLKEVFSAVLHYMQTVATKQQLKDPTVRQGLHAVMALARSAQEQIEKIQGQGSVTGLQEVKNLELFYSQKISPHIFKEIKELDSAATLEGESVGVDVFQDINKVRRDEAYELFLIRKEDGKGYFTNALLRHICLVAQFDALLLHFADDQPFTKIDILSDRDCHESAKEVLKSAAPLIDVYYKEALKFKQLSFVSLINKALMALMLAANPRNLISNTIAKNAFKYYQDFHSYLRDAFTSVEYVKLKEMGSDRAEHFLHTVMQLSLELCSSFFLRTSSKKEEILLIHSLIKEGGKGSVTKSAQSSPLAFWNRLLDSDGSLRLYFKQYPSAPLLKVARMIEREELLEGFDPLSQGFYPNQLYVLNSKHVDVSVLRLPSPTRQEVINRAEMVPEFRAWIGSMKAQGHHHLLINLQDRTAWKEYARCVCLEENQVPDVFSVITFPKHTEFYNQSGSYVQWDDASEFMKLCKDQLLSEQSGFYFPPEMKREELKDFVDPALSVIHSLFFGKKERLTEQNRLDFIEIFYLFLTLKLVEILQVDSVSFSCKDGVDLGAAMDGQLFAFIKMMNGQSAWEKEESDLLLWILYSPALLARGRLIESSCLKRMVSALEVVGGALDTEASSVSKSCSQLYSLPFFKGLKVNFS